MLSKIVKKSFNELTNEELYRIFDLRFKVFVMEQKILYLDTDFKDQNSIHYMIFEDDQLVSYLRLVLPGFKYKEYALSRIATDPDYRLKGLATELIRVSMNDVKGQPIRISGQAYLKDYYEKLGFKVVKGPYIEEDILHYEM
ncbi:MAG: GNAT family N-acetyltransferase, partial [Acholeplasmataceae bacterium]|nr:GNAT family N-acetyltransferase [Acholeplasmataceae bacterium]